MGVKREILADGKVLRALILQFEEKRTEQNLIGLLTCLRDSFVWIPCNVEMNDTDTKKFLGAKAGDTITAEGNIRMIPDILQNGEELFFPVFSSNDQMGEDYGSHFSKVQKHLFEAMSMAMARKDVVAIVLDAFTHPFVIEKKLFDLIGRLPSQIDDED